MKKIIVTLSLALLTLYLPHTTFAQTTRLIDLALEITAPTNGETIPNGGASPLTIKLTNNSADTIKPSDTLAIKFLNFEGLPNDQWAKFNGNADILPGTTVNIGLGSNFSSITNNRQTETDTTFTSCITVNTVFDATGDTLSSNFREIDTTNNRSCFEVTYKGGTVSIKQINKSPVNNMTIYPNPNYNGIFSLNYDISEKSDATVHIMDLAGRVLLKNNLGTQDIGNHSLDFDLGKNIASGTYLVELRTGTFRKVSKLIINK